MSPTAAAATNTTAGTTAAGPAGPAGRTGTAGTAGHTGTAGTGVPGSALGHVTFLGAGPGDPGLLTLRAVEALAHADVLVADGHVLDVVRTHARPGVDTAQPGDAEGS